MSTAFHPETDGQTEIANQALKAYLRCYVNFEQDNWAEMLPIAEFEANSSQTVTGLSPFEAVKGYLPRNGTEAPGTLPPGWKAARDALAADKLIARIELTKKRLQQTLSWVQAKMKEQVDAQRRPAPELRIGDWVMLDARNVRVKDKARGLVSKNLGPFQIVDIFQGHADDRAESLSPGQAFKLDFGDNESLKGIHLWFHPWLLHLQDMDPLPGQRQEPQGPVAVEERLPVYEVEEILSHKEDRRRTDPETGKRGLLMFLIKWVGYDDPNWEPYTNVTGCGELLRQYYDKHKSTPRRKDLEEQTALLAVLWLGEQDRLL